MATFSQDVNIDATPRQLKVVQERWRQSNRRSHGHYAKTPEASVMNNLKNALIAPLSNINNNLLLPQLSVSNWLDVSIGLLLSIEAIRMILESSSSSLKSPLLVDIHSFIKKWMSAISRLQPPKKNSNELTQLLNTKFRTPINVPTDTNAQLTFIIHDILHPFIVYSVPAKKIYHCMPCNNNIEVVFQINYIQISMVDSQFRFNQQLSNYFSDTISDRLCSKCCTFMSRQIKLLDCKDIDRFIYLR